MKYTLILYLLFPALISAQNLAMKSRYSDMLKCGNTITMYATTDCSSCYYYLPTKLTISRKADGTPEISLVTWKNDDNSKVIGGILHFLVSWGIGQEDEDYIGSRLRSKVDSAAVVLGPASVQPTSDSPRFGDDDLATLLTSHLTSLPPAPTTPGAKMAFSFRFDEEGIEKLMKYVDSPSRAGTKLMVAYTYMLVKENGMTATGDVLLELPLSDLFKLIR